MINIGIAKVAKYGFTTRTYIEIEENLHKVRILKNSELKHPLFPEIIMIAGYPTGNASYFKYNESFDEEILKVALNLIKTADPLNKSLGIEMIRSHVRNTQANLYCKNNPKLAM